MENIIKTYCMKGSSIIVKGQHANFQVTTTLMEVKDRFNSDLSGLDLTECENILKKIYHIDKDAELIILKFVMDDGVTLKYDIYDPSSDVIDSIKGGNNND